MRTTARYGAATAIIALFIGTAPGAAAQTPPSGAAQPAPTATVLLPVVSKSLVVWVTTTDGRERKGRLMSFTPDQLVIRVGNAREVLNTADVVRIDTLMPDPLSNGRRNGAIAGAIVGGVGFGALMAACERDCGGGGAAVGGAIAVGLYALMGMGIGALIDAGVEGRQPIYSRSTPPRVSLRPIVGGTRQGIQLRVVW